MLVGTSAGAVLGGMAAVGNGVATWVDSGIAVGSGVLVCGGVSVGGGVGMLVGKGVCVGSGAGDDGSAHAVAKATLAKHSNPTRAPGHRRFAVRPIGAFIHFCSHRIDRSCAAYLRSPRRSGPVYTQSPRSSRESENNPSLYHPAPSAIPQSEKSQNHTNHSSDNTPL